MDSNGGSSRNHPQPNLSDFITVWFKLCISYVTLYIFSDDTHKEDLTGLWLSPAVALQNLCLFLRSY